MIDFSKPLQTRSGKEVRIYAKDGAWPYVVHGAIKREQGWELSTWFGSGEYSAYRKNSPHDLINVPVRFRQKRWVNVYRTPSSLLYSTKEEACGGRDSSKCIACVEVVVEGVEGEGL